MKKTKLIIIAFAIGTIGAVVLFTLTNKTNPEPPPILPTPTPTPAQPLQVVSTAPSPGKQSIVLPNMALIFTFSQEIILEKTIVNVSPNPGIKTETKTNDRRVLYLKPKTNWIFGQKYLISISTSSVMGGTITDYEFLFEPQPPQTDKSQSHPYGI